MSCSLHYGWWPCIHDQALYLISSCYDTPMTSVLFVFLSSAMISVINKGCFVFYILYGFSSYGSVSIIWEIHLLGGIQMSCSHVLVHLFIHSQYVKKGTLCVFSQEGRNGWNMSVLLFFFFFFFFPWTDSWLTCNSAFSLLSHYQFTGESHCLSSTLNTDQTTLGCFLCLYAKVALVDIFEVFIGISSLR